MSERYEPVDQHWEQRVLESFARQGAMSLLGARILHLKPGVCSIGVAYRPELSQQHGYFHAGVTSTIGDSAGGYAALTLFDAASEVLTVEFTVNLLAPAVGEELVAYGQVIRTGKTISVCRVDVEAIKGGKTTVCAILQQTLMRVDIPER
ncbi:MAG TPA: PaaI family thioesterase [Candidatus Binatus sp.]|nr:PaaI family thioesterase [Candidatus Binatus sp.]